MECGQKSPPAAKFCPGCGNALSLNNDARVKDVEDAPDISDNEIKDIALPDGCVTISGGTNQPLTIKEVIASAPETPQNDQISRPPSRELSGLTKEQLARKLSQLNNSDGSKEA
jgi:hypothetical protein